MTIHELILKLQALDISFRLEDEKLKINAPDGVLNDALLQELKAHKAEIIDLLRHSSLCSKANHKNISKAPRQNRFPLSYAQQRLWFLYRLEPESPAYHMTGGVRVHTPLNPEWLRRSFEEIIYRHESLRTSFVEDDNQPWQLIQRPYRLEIEQIDSPVQHEFEVRNYLKRLADESSKGRPTIWLPVIFFG